MHLAASRALHFLLAIAAVYSYFVSKKLRRDLENLAITVIICAIGVGASLYSHTSVAAKNPLLKTIATPPKPLFCFDSVNTSIATSDVERGCTNGLISLGDGAIEEPVTEVSKVNSLLLQRFEAAQAIAKSLGIRLQITSGFRSKERQAELFAEEVEKLGSEAEASKWVLPPEYSRHPKGIALDVNYNFDPVSTMWLEKYGYIYGLCRVYENEWWHFEGNTAPGEACPALKPNALEDAQ